MTRRPMCGAGVIAVILASLGAAVPARAGTYEIASCPTIQQGFQGWSTEPGPVLFDPCPGAPNRDFALTLTDSLPGTGEVALRLTVDGIAPNTTIASVSTTLNNGAGPWTGNKAFGGIFAVDGTGQSTEVFAWEIPFAGGVTRNLPAGTRTLRFRIFCSTSVGGDTRCDTGDRANALRLVDPVLTFREDALPGAEVTGGDLIGGGPKSGRRSVSLVAKDLDSGVASVGLRLGDTAVYDESFAGVCVYKDFAPCPREQGRVVEVDTTKVADGLHALSIVVTDAAGNRNVVNTGRDVLVDNVPDPPPPPKGNGANPCQADCNLTVGGGKQGRAKTIRTKFTKPGGIAGTLSLPGGEPVRGAEIQVFNDAGREGTARTDDQGRFLYQVPAKLPTRRLRFAYTAYDNQPQPTVENSVLVKVKGATRIQIKPKRVRRGSKALIQGRISGGPFPNRGVLIEFQGRSPGQKRFRQFKTTRARATSNGFFKTSYRFSRKGRGTRFPIRAVVRSQEGYPYPTDYSTAQTLRVR